MHITLRGRPRPPPGLRWLSLTIARCPLGRPTGNLKTMLDALSIALPLVLAAVLIGSAVAKLRTPDDLSGWADLGVPRALRREWLRRAHPWAEGALGVSLAVLGSWLGLLAALVAVALMAAYTVLVARVLRAIEQRPRACFGTRRRVTTVTVARNGWGWRSLRPPGRDRSHRLDRHPARAGVDIERVVPGERARDRTATWSRCATAPCRRGRSSPRSRCRRPRPRCATSCSTRTASPSRSGVLPPRAWCGPRARPPCRSRYRTPR